MKTERKHLNFLEVCWGYLQPGEKFKNKAWWGRLGGEEICKLDSLS